LTRNAENGKSLHPDREGLAAGVVREGCLTI